GELLQERAIRRELRLQEERHLEDARALREALADALLLGKGIGRVLGVRHKAGPVSDSMRGPRPAPWPCRARVGAVSASFDCHGALRPRSGGWPLPAAGG